MNTPQHDSRTAQQHAGLERQTDAKVPPLPARVPLAQLPQVSVISSNPLLSALSKIERLLPQLPIELQSDARYQLELVNGELHIRGLSKGIKDFSLTEGGRSLLRIEEHAQALHITFALDAGDEKEIVVVLHRAPKKEPAPRKDREVKSSSSTSRRTSPWRADTLCSYDTAPSESRGGGSGER